MTMTESEIVTACEELGNRLSGIREHFKDRPTMKYALESLPELIGENQFKMLLLALDLDNDVPVVAKQDIGVWFATAIEHQASSIRRKRVTEERRLSSNFERILQQATAEPCVPSPATEQQQPPQGSPADSRL